MPDTMQTRPTITDIRNAAERLRGHARRTPLLESELLNQELGGRLLVKAEALQRSGSFKFRGAFNFISQLTEAERCSGVVAYSSGNHAQGVALAASLLNTPAVIIMPADAPTIKIENTRSYGAEVVLYDRLRESREEIGAKIAQERGSHLVPPYEHPWIMAGQGTVALELAEQAAELGAEPEALLVPCSGGGLSAGCALTMADRLPNAALYTVEPDGYDDTRQSLLRGERVRIEPTQPSLCDALLMPTPGELTFAVNRELVKAGLTVTDAEALSAMAVAMKHFKLVLEPGGAVALAAVLSGKLDCRGRTLAVVASGGNVDAAVLARALEVQA